MKSSRPATTTTVRALTGVASLLALAACSELTPLTSPTLDAPGTAPRASRGSGIVDASFVTGQVIVRYRDGADVAEVARKHGGRKKRDMLMPSTALVEVAEGGEEQLVAELEGDPDVLSAELDYLTVINPCEVGFCVAPNDGFVKSYRWDLNNTGTIVNSSSPTGALQATGKVDADVDFDEAFDALGGTAFAGTAVIGILDSGIRPDHIEFANGRIIAARNFATGYPADLIADRDGHGTHVAGIAAGLSDGRGTVGLAFGKNIKLINAKICELYNTAPAGQPQVIQTSCPTSSQADAIRWAVDNGANVLNMSIGGSPLATSGSPAVQASLAYAISKNVLPVCAAGNDNYPNMAFPARFADCLAVGATNWSDARASYSNYGGKLEITAPGGDGNALNTASSLIMSASFSAANQYTWKAGTSMAAPQVTGLAAMLYASGMTTVAEVKARILSTADDLGAPGYDAQFGNGRINMYRALTLKEPNAPPTAVTGGDVTGVEGSAVAFSSAGSIDPNNHPIRFLWTFGDGATSTAANPTHVYADNGAYAVTLTVTDESNRSTTSTSTATIANALPVVTAAMVPTRILSGATSTMQGSFSDAGVNDAPWSWTVSSRDGSASGSTSVQGAITSSARYCSVGATPVTLTVTDKDGGAGAATALLTVDANVVSVGLPGAINANSNGKLPVKIFGSESLDVSAIDLSTLRIAGASVVVKNNGTFQAAISDLNGDGRPDLMVHVERADLTLVPGSAPAGVSFTLADGCARYEGSSAPVSVK